MPRVRSSSSSAALLALTLLPLIPLGAVIYLGMESQRTSMLTAGDRLAAREAQDVVDELVKRTSTPFYGPRFPNPPQPGQPSDLDAILDSSDDAALLALQQRYDAGYSPAGLPRQALAAIRRLELRGQAVVDPAWVALLTEREPSLLTAEALKRARSSPFVATNRLAANWNFIEELPALCARNPKGGWTVADGGQPCWVSEPWDGSFRRGAELQFLPPSEVSKMVAAHLPGQYVFRITHDTAPPRTRGAEDLAAAVLLPGGSGLRLEAYFGPDNLLQKDVVRSQRWSWSIVAAAFAVLGGGLWRVHVTLKRERKLNEMKSQFVASVSHELRSPVASIRLMAEALDAGKVEPETAGEFHRLIAREGARLSTLVGNVLDHARIEQGRRVWKMEPCNLAELVADTVRVMEPLAAEKKITLSVESVPLDSAVDAGAIQQALVNLLDNAIKFSPPESAVEIILSNYDKDSSWELRVRDTGPGVPKQEQTRIFERFYRPGDELRRESQGTGIGLSLVKSIAEAHRGTVRVESDSGHGSTFILLIPLA